MSLRILAPIDSISATDLSYADPSGGLLFLDSSGSSSIVPLASGQLVGTGSTTAPSFTKTSLGRLVGSVDHTAVDTGDTYYQLNIPSAETFPFIYFQCTFTRQTSAQVTTPIMHCTYNDTTNDGASNYRRRSLVWTGSASSTVSANNSYIQLGYSNSNLTTDPSQSCLVEGNAYVKTGAHRVFFLKSAYATTSPVSSINIMCNSWINTADVLTGVRLTVPSYNSLKFRLFQRGY